MGQATSKVRDVHPWRFPRLGHIKPWLSCSSDSLALSRNPIVLEKARAPLLQGPNVLKVCWSRPHEAKW